MATFTEHSQKIINISKTCSDDTIKPEHLLTAILYVEDCEAYSLLKRYFTDEMIDERKNKHNLTVPSEPISKPLSRDAERVLRQASSEAQKLKRDHIKSEHILLALSAIGLININYNDIRNDVIGLSSSNASEEEKNIPVNSFADGVSNSPTTSKSVTSDSKTPNLDEFTHDLTKLAKDNLLDPVIGRDVELERLVEVLARRKKNNPIIVGDAGCGKTALVELLAMKIVRGEAPEILQNKRVVVLEVATILAGTKFRGDFEERMKNIVNELKANQNIIVFIDEIHTMVGAGGGSGSLDVANILKPALSRGEISCIGATTFTEIKGIEKDAALMRRFQKVTLRDLSADKTIEILMNLKERYEMHHMVKFSDEAIVACVKLAEKFITNRSFPDKAIDVMDEAGASVRANMTIADNVKKLMCELDDAIKNKQTAAQQQQFTKAADYRLLEQKLISDIEAAKQSNTELQRKSDKNIITPRHIAEVVARITGIPSNTVNTDDSMMLTTLADNLKRDVIGQDVAVDAMVRSIIRNKAGLTSNNQPIGVFMLIGNTGVGKTHISKMLAKYLFGSEKNLIRLDMSEYMDKHSTAKLIGAPAGYVGYDDGGQLTDKIKNKPHAILLLDEVEKAHPEVWNIMLQVFDDGRLTDSQGRTIDFRNVLIIMTSNVGVKESGRKRVGFGQYDDYARDIIEKEFKDKFSPEFINRIDEVINCEKLTKENIIQIIDIELNNTVKYINAEHGFTVKVDESAKDFLFNKGWDDKYGARPLKRAIKRYMLDELSLMVITKNVFNGDEILVTFNEGDEKLTFGVQSTTNIEII